MKKVLIIIIIIIIIGLFLISLLRLFFPPLEIETENKIYGPGQEMRIKIKNWYYKKFCFSSCYPYYIQVKDGEKWKNIPYALCKSKDEIKICLEPGKTKAFKLILPVLVPFEKGLYRLAVPVCENCREQEIFSQEKIFYSAEFNINK